MIALASRPGGVNNLELSKVLGLPIRTTSARTNTAAHRGNIFAANAGKNVSYYATKEAADAARTPAVAKPTRKPDHPGLTRHTAGSSKRADKSGACAAPIFNEKTRYTIAPPIQHRARWELQPAAPALFADHPRYGGYE